MTLALAIQGLRKTYPSGVEALKGVDLSVEEGDFFALLGPNGAGKSTVIGIVCSLLRKTTGAVSVFGYNIDRDIARAKSCIGLVPQEFNFNQFEPIVEIVTNQAGYYGIDRHTADQRAEKYLTQLQLWERRFDMARELSGGMKRRLMIARALVHEPRLLILDEPTAGVDIEIRRSMWEFLRTINAQGTTVILTTHYLEEAENLCKHIAIINNGLTIASSELKTLLMKLHVETFLLNIKQPLTTVPQISGFTLSLVDDSTLAVNITKDQNMNDLFQELAARRIDVLSMRNKTNRLEEMFMRLVDRGEL
ncbi:MAG: ABC transporter ATP-binding protein [Gammaproteobacteria bacterium]|nr:ABC transporter ATP-binding protein [Gammaproteobacteria bacterium]